MQTKTPPPLPSVVKREDKVDSLRTFISAFFVTGSVGAPHHEITVVARSAESPVTRALTSLAADIASRGLSVRAIFLQPEPEKVNAGWFVTGPEIAFHRVLRWAKNPRLADAHEQLVLDDKICWIGDCMRRDPSRRDAYENFVNGDALTAKTIATSFSRLWDASVPLQIRAPSGAAGLSPNTETDCAEMAGLTGLDDNSGPLASSPH